jgi:ribosome-binding protein aMBF1 (putative translation factor)
MSGRPTSTPCAADADAPSFRPGNRQPTTALRLLLADNVIRLRKARGWSQEQLAAACRLTKGHISKIEQAALNVSLATLEALTVGFACLPADLLIRIHSPAPPEIPRAARAPRE